LPLTRILISYSLYNLLDIKIYLSTSNINNILLFAISTPCHQHETDNKFDYPYTWKLELITNAIESYSLSKSPIESMLAVISIDWFLNKLSVNIPIDQQCSNEDFN
jgi:hypothetical protein